VTKAERGIGKNGEAVSSSRHSMVVATSAVKGVGSRELRDMSTNAF
jgi:hypothetical protein